MYKVLGTVLCAVFSVGCTQSDEAKLRENCEDLLRLAVVSPSRLIVNSIELHSKELERSEVEEVGMGGPSRRDVLDIWYDEKKDIPKQTFVMIDFTDEGGAVPARGTAYCRYYSDKISIEFISALLANRKIIQGEEALGSFLTTRRPPRHMNMLGMFER